MHRHVSLLIVLILGLTGALAGTDPPDVESKIDPIFAWCSEPGLPGAAVSVIRDGEVVFSKGYGLANLELDVPITPKSIFYLGSVSKQFVAAAIVLLEGREVTLVSYHPETTSLASLVEKATDAGLADKIFVATRGERRSLSRERRTSAGSLDESYRAAGESDQKRQIRGTVYDELTLSPMQRTKVNAFARSDPEEARAWLTPEQLRELERRVAESRLDD